MLCLSHSILDAIAQKITVLEWVDGLYEEQVYQGDQAIVSSQFSGLNLIAGQILVAGS